MNKKKKRLSIEERQEASRQKTIKAELEWVRSNAKGRHAKNKARLQRFDELNSQEYQRRSETNEIYIPRGDRLGDSVIELKNVSKSYADKTLINDLSLTVPKGSIIGIIGGNGAGKSTLFKMITGIEKPDRGEIKIGETVKIAYVEQLRDEMDNNHSVWESVSNGHEQIQIGGYEVSSRAYIGRFNFKGTDQQKKVGELSGGGAVDYNLPQH